MAISRRNLLSIASIGPMAGLVASAQASKTFANVDQSKRQDRVPFEPTNVTHSTNAFLKLTGSLATEPVRHWFTGKIYLYVPGEKTRELCYTDGFLNTQYTALEDGTHKHERYEIVINRDIESGDILEEWKNPFTGRTNQVAHTVGGPQYKVYNQWGFDSPKKARGPDNPRPLDWIIFGDDAWLTWDLFLQIKNPISKEKHPLEYSGDLLDLTNLTNYKASLSDIEDPNILNAPSVMFWTGVSSWFPWMQMGEKQGALIHKVIGTKVDSFSDLPEQVFRAAEKAFPGHLSEQRPWMEGAYPWNDFVTANS